MKNSKAKVGPRVSFHFFAFRVFFFVSPLYPAMKLNYNKKGRNRNVEEHLNNGQPSTSSNGLDGVKL